MNKKGFTLVEIMMATLISVVLFVGIFNFYYVSKSIYALGIARQALEDGAHVVVSKMIEGGTEAGGGTYRLAQGVSYCIGSGASCGTVTTSELHFRGTDSIERWYSLNNTNTALIYHHPIAGSPGGADETIYTAPMGAAMTLLFWIPAVNNYPAAAVGVNVTLTKNVFGKNVTGSAATVVTLRNHP